jgi:hypothetical protein
MLVQVSHLQHPILHLHVLTQLLMTLFDPSEKQVLLETTVIVLNTNISIKTVTPISIYQAIYNKPGTQSNDTGLYFNT